MPAVSPWLRALAIVAATLVAYLPALGAGFVWDDDDYVTRNPLLRHPDGLARIWFSADAPSQYFPLVYTTFRLEYALFGLEPFGYHLVNVCLHAANGLLAWRLLARLALPGAWLAGAIFALHPVHVESVAWISERKNLLSGVFYLASALAYLRHVETEGRGQSRSRSLYAASLALFLCRPARKDRHLHASRGAPARALVEEWLCRTTRPAGSLAFLRAWNRAGTHHRLARATRGGRGG